MITSTISIFYLHLSMIAAFTGTEICCEKDDGWVQKVEIVFSSKPRSNKLIRFHSSRGHNEWHWLSFLGVSVLGLPCSVLWVWQIPGHKIGTGTDEKSPYASLERNEAVALATQELSHMIDAGQISTLLTKIQRHWFDLRKCFSRPFELFNIIRFCV